MLIDRADCDALLPPLTLESYPISPLMHMKLQSELVNKVFDRFGQPKNVATTSDILEYKKILEDWIETFPPSYQFDQPDTRKDDDFPWISLHRHYLHTIALSMTLGPLRMFMAKHLNKDSSEVERNLRKEGVIYAMRLLGAVHSFFDWVWTRDTTFHFVPFCIFDTAALLCSAVIHDEDGNLPRIMDIYLGIDLALLTLKKLSKATGTAKTPYGILKQIAGKLPQTEYVLKNLNNSFEGGKRLRMHNESASFTSPPTIHPRYNSNGDFEDLGYSYYGSSSSSGPSSSAESTSTGSPPIVISSATGLIDFATSANVSPGYDSPATPDTSAMAIVAPHPNDLIAGLVAGGPLSGYTGVHVPGQPATPPLIAAVANGGPIQHSAGLTPGKAAVLSPSDTNQLASGPQTPSDHVLQALGFEQITEAEMGDLAVMWNWESLNLDFGSNPML